MAATITKDPRLAKIEAYEKESRKYRDLSRKADDKANNLRSEIAKEKREEANQKLKSMIGKVYVHATEPEPGIYRKENAYYVIKQESTRTNYNSHEPEIDVVPYSLALLKPKNAKTVRMAVKSLLDPALFVEYSPKPKQPKAKA